MNCLYLLMYTTLVFFRNSLLRFYQVYYQVVASMQSFTNKEFEIIKMINMGLCTLLNLELQNYFACQHTSNIVCFDEKRRVVVGILNVD